MLNNYPSEFAALAITHFLAAVAPGPDFAITISQTVRHGRKVGVITALGIGAGISIHVLYTLLGVGTLMHTSPDLLHWAKAIGACYLIYLGWALIRSKARIATDIDTAAAESAGRGAFITGFLTNALNPKATLFFLAIFTTLISASTPKGLQIFYGIWMCAVNAIWFALVSILFSQPTVRLAFLRCGHWFERAMGVLLIGFAIRLLLRW